MITTRFFQRWLNKLFPPTFGERWDNLGWQKLKPSPKGIHVILLTLDLTHKACQQAVENQVDLIICHHPFLFPTARRGLKNKTTRLLWKTLQTNQIGVFALHTNFDNCYNGMNDYILKQLNAQQISCNSDQIFSGILPTQCSLQKLIDQLKQIFKVKTVMVYGSLQQPVTKLVVVAGAGGSQIRKIKSQPNLVFITGELKWSQMLEIQERKLTTIVVGHEMENIFISALQTKLSALPVKVIGFPTDNQFKFY